MRIALREQRKEENGRGAFANHNADDEALQVEGLINIFTLPAEPLSHRT